MANHILLKRGRYYFRRRLPRKLALRLGVGEIVKALPLCSRTQAIEMARHASTNFDNLFRKAMSDDKLNRKQLDKIALGIYNEMIAEFDRTRKPRWTKEGEKSAKRRIEGAEEQLKIDFWEHAKEYVDDALKAAGIAINPSRVITH